MGPEPVVATVVVIPDTFSPLFYPSRSYLSSAIRFPNAQRRQPNPRFFPPRLLCRFSPLRTRQGVGRTLRPHPIVIGAERAALSRARTRHPTAPRN